MRKSFILLVLGQLLAGLVHAQGYARFEGNESATWEEAIARYRALSERYAQAFLHELGSTDVGLPLHVFIIDPKGKGTLEPAEEGVVTLLVNNGIHPGEPCGVDASLKLAEDLLQGNVEVPASFDHVRLAIIPIYNIGGALNRGCCSRANQNGPAAYGFRGNAKNLDLNRDFIKTDSKNSAAFQAIFHRLQPEVFVDTHTSNGADYQYTMTLITTQPDKAAAPLNRYIRETANPAVYAQMAQRGWKMTPYVYSMGRTPADGIKDFLETPRYSTGYAALFNVLGFTSETHMFKPFADRVESTYQFLLGLMHHVEHDRENILAMKAAADQLVADQRNFPLQWALDSTAFRSIEFDGFVATTEPSEVHGKDRLRYDRTQPETQSIRYFDRYRPVVSVEAPEAYVIPQAWQEVIERLEANRVEVRRLERDTLLEVEVYYITDHQTGNQPYEGHYLHQKVQVAKRNSTMAFRAGDAVVHTQQATNRYIVETLEPQGVDSFFAWNYFDSILQQKEWFSDYVFEEKAKALLEEQPELKAALETRKADDPSFAASAFQQLYFLYQNSEHFELSFNRYPVYRAMQFPPP